MPNHSTQDTADADIILEHKGFSLKLAGECRAECTPAVHYGLTERLRFDAYSPRRPRSKWLRHRFQACLWQDGDGGFYLSTHPVGEHFCKFEPIPGSEATELAEQFGIVI